MKGLSDKRRFVLKVVRYIFVILILWWLTASGKIDLSHIKQSLILSPGTIFILITSVLLIASSLSLLAYRWQQTLKIHGIFITYPSALSATFQSNFFSIVLPGMAGGDLIKIAYLSKNLEARRLTAFYSTLLDRLLGVSALVLLAISSAGMLYLSSSVSQLFDNEQMSTFITWSFFAVLTTLILGLTLVYVLPKQMFLLFFEKIPFLNIDEQLSCFVATCISNKRRFFWLLLLSCLNHIVNLVIYLLIALLLAIQLTPFVQFTISAICMLFNLLPITPGGIGLTESAFSYIFSLAGSEVGGTLSLLVRILNYLVFLLAGLSFFLVFGSRLNTHLREKPVGFNSEK